jgi:hypothetical protein
VLVAIRCQVEPAAFTASRSMLTLTAALRATEKKSGQALLCVAIN